jgi:hypothetical protein
MRVSNTAAPHGTTLDELLASASATMPFENWMAEKKQGMLKAVAPW